MADDVSIRVNLPFYIVLVGALILVLLLDTRWLAGLAISRKVPDVPVNRTPEGVTRGNGDGPARDVNIPLRRAVDDVVPTAGVMPLC